MEIHHDWEFLDDGHTITPIEVALQAEDGRSYHAIFEDMPVLHVKAHPFLRRAVWPHLPRVTRSYGDALDTEHPSVKPRAQIRSEVLRFISATPDPRLWGVYPAYDHVVLAQLWGPMVSLPNAVPMRTSDVMQEWDRLGRPRLPEMPEGTAHHPLADARWSLFLRRWLRHHEVARAGLVPFLSAAKPEIPTAEELLRAAA